MIACSEGQMGVDLHQEAVRLIIFGQVTSIIYNKVFAHADGFEAFLLPLLVPVEVGSIRNLITDMSIGEG